MQSFLLISPFILFGLSACVSSVTKVDYPASSEPTKVIAEIHKDMRALVKEQVDIFSHDNYEQAEKHLTKAEELQKIGAPNSQILDEAASAKAYLVQAKSEAAMSKPELPTIVRARERALAAGANVLASKALKELDRRFVFYVDKAGVEKATPEETEFFRKKYLDLELQAVTQSQLRKTKISEGAVVEQSPEVGVKR